MPETLFLFDGMALAYRSYFSLIARPLLSPSGENVSAVYGFVSALMKVVEDEKPQHVAVCFDTKEPTFRHKMYKPYKATRDAMPDDMIPQLDTIKEVIRAFNIALIELPGYEADDIIGTLARMAEREKVESYLVTPDKDFCQLVSKHIKVYRPPRFGNEYEILDIEGVKKKFGVPPEQVIDVLGLMGDTSDNIPGVPGIGEKTAMALVQENGTILEIYKHLDRVAKEGVRKKLEAGKDLAMLSRTLVTIDTAVPLDVDVHALRAAEPDAARLRDIFLRLNFKSFMRRFGGESPAADAPPVGDEAAPAATAAIQTAATVKHTYHIVETAEALKTLVAKLEKAKRFSFDLETTSLDAMDAEIVGVALAVKPHEAYYVAVLSESASTGDMFSGDARPARGMASADVVAHLKKVLTDESILKVGQNLKYDMLVMKNHGVEVSPVGFDSMVASYILRPDGAHDMDSLARQYLNYSPISIKELIGTGKSQINMRDVDVERVAEYAGEDADVTLQLVELLEKKLKSEQVLDVCTKIDFPLIPVLVDLEFNGVKIDTTLLGHISKEIERELGRLTTEIHNIAGGEFNINSTKQLADLLFVKLGLPASKKTKTGYSTDMSVLEELADQHVVPAKILEFRQLGKLKATYVDALPRQVNARTGLIHTNFSQTIAATGRLSSNDPNLQNIPVRTPLGQEIRKAFVSRKKGWELISADYSQIELRVMAHLSGDPGFAGAFAMGEDVHRTTAALVFGVAPNEVTGEMRRRAKAVNFGIMYGLGAFGLSSRLGIPQTESREIIRTYFERFPNVKQYIDTTIAFAREHGYTQTLSGRRRFYPNINNRNATIRQGEERQAINMPIQGTSADMIKIAMISIHHAMRKKRFEGKMILQVHDELVFDAPKDEIKELSALVKMEMEGALPLSVPVEVDLGVGKNWMEAH